MQLGDIDPIEEAGRQTHRGTGLRTPVQFLDMGGEVSDEGVPLGVMDDLAATGFLRGNTTAAEMLVEQSGQGLGQFVSGHL